MKSLVERLSGKSSQSSTPVSIQPPVQKPVDQKIQTSFQPTVAQVQTPHVDPFLEKMAAAKYARIVKLQDLAKIQRKVSAKQLPSIPKEVPKPYRIAEEGEITISIDCVHVACEGNGSFDITDSYLSFLEAKGSRPKNCYQCRLWTHQARVAQNISGICEKCDKAVIVSFNRWIGYHKFTGKPLFTHFCTNCKRIEEHVRLHPHQYPRTQSGVAVRLKANPTRFSGVQSRNKTIDLEDVQHKIVALPLHGFALDELVEIQSLDETPNNNWYHTHGTKDDGVVQTRYEHVKAHVVGSGRKKATLQDIGTTIGVIHFAYIVACKTDSSVVTVPIEKGGFVKLDLLDGVKLVFSQESTGKYFLTTAFRNSSLTKLKGSIPKKEELIAIEVMKMLSDDRVAL